MSVKRIIYNGVKVSEAWPATIQAAQSLIDSGSGRGRQGNFAPAGCRRGAHGVTRPTMLGSRRVFSISLPTSEFGSLHQRHLLSATYMRVQ
jgi:hypothetical protein